MTVTLYRPAESQAKDWADSGKVDKSTAWSLSAEEENKMLGDPPDWDAYGKMHLGNDPDADKETKAAWKYPYGKNGKVYRSALIAIRQRAGQQDAGDIFDAAGRILNAVDKKDEKQSNAWYRIRAAGNDLTEILIYGDIGESWFDDSVTARQFVKDLADVKSAAINVRINSYGGSVADGIAIYNAIRRHPARTTTSIDGVAVSIASLIAMAGDSVQMADNAMMMIHAPWGGVVGNAADMRDMADILDQYASAMSTSYAGKTGKTVDEVMPWLTDGADHWFTAQEALAAGLADAVIAAAPITARFDLTRYISRPKTAEIFNALSPSSIQLPEAKKVDINTPSIEKPNNTPGNLDADAIRAQALQDEQARRTEIRALFANFSHLERAQPVLNACLDDHGVSLDIARAKLLDALGKDTHPINDQSRAPRIEAGKTDRDLWMEGCTQAILARHGGLGVKHDPANEFRGMKLLDFAKASLERNHISLRGKEQREVVAMAFTQSTSDFPVLLENVLHKSLLMAWNTAPDTWTRFCVTGSVTDFRAHNRYRVGSIANLDALGENGEFKNRSIPDAEKASITAITKGNLVNISRQAIINDDLNAFLTLSIAVGRAAKRTIEADVYALLASNPVMTQDGKTMFHADHNNIIPITSNPTVAAIEKGRQMLASQKDVGANDYLDLIPEIFLGNLASASDAKVINFAEYDVDDLPGSSTLKSQAMLKPNRVRGLFKDIVESARITDAKWYMFASPVYAPALEVAFLDGMQEPYLELQQGFTVDGAIWKVRLDYGVAPLEWRSVVMNPGA